MNTLPKITKEDQRIASSSSLLLKDVSQQINKNAKGGVKIRIQESDNYITIPKKALTLLSTIVANMAEGKPMTLLPLEAEVSTQQAADMLNVSRPHLVKLLEEGKIPFKKVGSHRRILLEALIDYETQSKKERKQHLEFLAKQAQELNLGYE